jgi:hypothetical protein
MGHFLMQGTASVGSNFAANQRATILFLHRARRIGVRSELILFAAGAGRHRRDDLF